MFAEKHCIRLLRGNKQFRFRSTFFRVADAVIRARARARSATRQISAKQEMMLKCLEYLSAGIRRIQRVAGDNLVGAAHIERQIKR